MPLTTDLSNFQSVADWLMLNSAYIILNAKKVILVLLKMKPPYQITKVNTCLI